MSVTFGDIAEYLGQPDVECRARAGTPRPPHPERLTLRLGQLLLGASLDSTDPLDAAEILTSIRLGERTGPRNLRDVEDIDSRTST